TVRRRPDRAGEVGWRHVPQGGEGQPVYCCHTEVSGKHWVYPVAGEAGQTRPIEFAFGALEIHDSKMGCDLRPIDPAHPRAEEAKAVLAACTASHGPTEGNGVTSSYYERGDLGHFTDIGNYAKPLMNRFWAYYNGVFGEDGALTRREKALIGLAVGDLKQNREQGATACQARTKIGNGRFVPVFGGAGKPFGWFRDLPAQPPAA